MYTLADRNDSNVASPVLASFRAAHSGYTGNNGRQTNQHTQVYARFDNLLWG